MGWCGLDWYGSGYRWRALANAVMNLRDLNSGKLSSGCITGWLSSSYDLQTVIEVRLTPRFSSR
jgi:hypothetical protein